MKLNNKLLIAHATKLAVFKRVSHDVKVGEVACVLLTASENLYTGINIQACCGLGFCAEYSAIAKMITAGETLVKIMVAVDDEGTILSPCGRCREFFFQINPNNVNMDVILAPNKTIKLEKLLPYNWQKLKKKK